jgi:hypothetical protein
MTKISLARKKQFILGVGAQRTGSTWLRSQLANCARVDLGFCKEYHFFDVLFSPQMQTYHDEPELTHASFPRIQDKIVSIVAAGKSKRLAAFVQSPDRYFNYFDNLWAKKANVTTVGDFTPSYSMLDRKAFEYAKDELNKRGFSVKVLFIMRDPVERIWSMKHQEGRMKKILRDVGDVEKPKISLESFTFEHAELRTRYERTIHELEQVFDSNDIYYEFYERYISKDRFSMLTDFVGVDSGDPDINTVRNASYMKDKIDPALATEVANYYKETYQFIESRFGEEIRSLWSGYQYITYE